MFTKKFALATAGLATAAIAGLGLLSSGSMAQAETANPTSTPSATTSATAGTGQGTPDQDGNGCEGRGGKGGPGHSHTAATSDETAKVTAAVKAKDATITVENVMKDEDGSFDVRGTKDGSPVHVEVSADLKTIEVLDAADRGGRGPGGRGGHDHTAATTDETAKVTAAVKAKDATITVENVMKDEDGSFDVRGTKDGSPVHVEVSADLKTIEVRTKR
ncbi:hypothetical protein [Aestuariimicrobium ganziense]|uniref:hypothetical protein n=1 Tax=Aestuariimicrobium ganziense TaxID=2773677 RepID=UPI001940BFB0|nr:hypothetical protein [Aestuariimicrobium ganziense]